MIRSASSIFVDSGAFSLYTQKIKKTGCKDYSFYSLKKGSEFRAYCDAYASMIKRVGKKVIFANVDVIYNPELTWETQKYFEDQHGVNPVPIVHFRTPMKYVDRYLENTEPIYNLIGVGGFAWGGNGTTRWLDEFFLHICKESSGYKPIIKVHGFALTSWSAIVRWPWWSVDSTTWFTTAAYGGIYLPRWTERSGWRYDCSPHVIQVSAYSGSITQLGRHYHSLTKAEKHRIDEWLHSIGTDMKQVSGQGNKQGRGEDPSYIARSFVNLTYFKNLEEDQPEYPWALNTDKVWHQTTFGL